MSDESKRRDEPALEETSTADALSALSSLVETTPTSTSPSRSAPAGPSASAPTRHPLVQALIESETRYRTIFESEPACVKLVGEDGTLLSMNPAGLAMVEADREDELIGASVYDLVVPKDRDSFIAMNERIFQGDHAQLEFEIEGCKGTRRQMETYAAPLADETGHIVAQLAVTHDITERKREHAELMAYRERLEALVAERTRELEASRDEVRQNEQLAALGTLAAGLAHELNNPLGTILLGAEMAESASNDADREQALASIRRDVARCSHIVKSMLRFGRGESSVKEPISINQVVRRARDDARAVVQRRALDIRVELAPDLPLVLGNDTELGQVLLNLIQNAANGSPVGARVEIETRLAETAVECIVTDHGRGMPTDVLSRARDPFFTTRLNAGGTGLGLSVSHGIVADHGGRLTIDSIEGRGTIVVVSLPTADR